jgi:hypothetical protein
VMTVTRHPMRVRNGRSPISEFNAILSKSAMAGQARWPDRPARGHLAAAGTAGPSQLAVKFKF